MKGGLLFMSRGRMNRRGRISNRFLIALACVAPLFFAAQGDAQAVAQPVQPGQRIAAKSATAPGRAKDSATAPTQAVKHATSSAHSARAKNMAAKGRLANRASLSLAPVPPSAPALPPAPNWPALASARPAVVHWDGNKLSVTAANSSLQQILQAVSAATGVAVEGMPSDQRVFGSYGPATARQVLSQLLEGSGYDLLMVGDGGDGKPRKVLLTARGTSPVEAAARPAYSAAAPGTVTVVQDAIVNPEAPKVGQWTVGKPANNGANNGAGSGAGQPADAQPDTPPGTPNGSNLTPQQFIEQRMQQINQRNAAQQQQPPQ